MRNVSDVLISPLGVGEVLVIGCVGLNGINEKNGFNGTNGFNERNGLTKKSYLAWLLATAMVLVTLSCSSLRAEEEIASYPGDLLQQMIELAVEYHPLLQSQREILNQLQRLQPPSGFLELKLKLTGGAGLHLDEDTHDVYFAPTAGLNLEIPIIDLSRRREIEEEKVGLIKVREETQQKYIQLKNSVISELLSQVTKLVQLSNEKEKVVKLKESLDKNLLVLRKQVEAGLTRDADIWTLSERIVDTGVRIDNLSIEISTLKRKTAITLGGEEWQTLLKMLDGVTLASLL